MPVDALEDTEVAGEVAEILTFIRPQIRALSRSRRLRSRRVPSRGTSRRPDDAAIGRHRPRYDVGAHHASYAVAVRCVSSGAWCWGAVALLAAACSVPDDVGVIEEDSVGAGVGVGSTDLPSPDRGLRCSCPPTTGIVLLSEGGDLWDYQPETGKLSLRGPVSCADRFGGLDLPVDMAIGSQGRFWLTYGDDSVFALDLNEPSVCHRVNLDMGLGELGSDLQSVSFQPEGDGSACGHLVGVLEPPPGYGRNIIADLDLAEGTVSPSGEVSTVGGSGFPSEVRVTADGEGNLWAFGLEWGFQPQPPLLWFGRVEETLVSREVISAIPPFGLAVDAYAGLLYVFVPGIDADSSDVMLVDPSLAQVGAGAAEIRPNAIPFRVLAAASGPCG